MIFKRSVPQFKRIRQLIDEAKYIRPEYRERKPARVGEVCWDILLYLRKEARNVPFDEICKLRGLLRGKHFAEHLNVLWEMGWITFPVTDHVAITASGQKAIRQGRTKHVRSTSKKVIE